LWQQLCEGAEKRRLQYKQCRGTRKIKRSQEVMVVKIAVTVAQGRLTARFLHAAEFARER
jgi:hypothetical protein